VLTVSHVFRNITVEPILVHHKENINSVHKKFILQKTPICRTAYVINDAQQIVGQITLRKIMNYVAIVKALTGHKQFSIHKLFKFISPDLAAEEIMEPAVVVKMDDSLETAFEIMMDKNVEEAAVVDEHGTVVGDLNIYEVLEKIEIDQEMTAGI